MNRANPFTTGFSLTPDEIYNIPSDEFAFGEGYSLAGVGVHTLRRWGHAVSFTDLRVRYDAEDLNDYGFYQNDMISLPEGWRPGALAGLPVPQGTPFYGVSTLIRHRPANDGPAKQNDHESMEVTSTGLRLTTDELDSSLFAPGDYLIFEFGHPAVLVLPSEARF